MIEFFYIDIDFKIISKKIVSAWIEKVVSDFKKYFGDISFIFSNDEYILDINKKYLNHDFYTDVITFDYCENNIISGDIFISIDRVLENSQDFNVSFSSEILRVMVHGVLHLLGFSDSSDTEKAEMRLLENNYISSGIIKDFSYEKEL